MIVKIEWPAHRVYSRRINMDALDHLSSLPLDTLKRIPTCYRMWQLLRICSHTLYLHLGDYHEYKGAIMLVDDKRIDYPSFASRIVTFLSAPHYELSLNMCIDCIWKTCQHSGEMQLESCTKLITWRLSTLTFHTGIGHESPVFRLARSYSFKIGSIVPTAVLIGNYYYELQLAICQSKTYALRRIYEDLPEVYSRMLIFKRALPEDTQ